MAPTNLALIHLHLATAQIGKPGAGPFSLPRHPMPWGTGRGGMATMLAAHREIGDPRDRAEVEQVWGLPPNSLSPTPGLSAVPLFEALRSGKVKAVGLPAPPRALDAGIGHVRKPAAGRVRDRAGSLPNTDTVPYADVLLPAAPGVSRKAR